MDTIGLDIGGTKIQGVLADSKCKIKKPSLKAKVSNLKVNHTNSKTEVLTQHFEINLLTTEKNISQDVQPWDNYHLKVQEEA